MRIIKTVISLLLIIPLCSCSALTQMKEVEDAVLVCALGFDLEGKFIKTSAEIAFNNDETTVLWATAKTVEEGLEKIGKNIPEKLILSHCATLVVGQSLSRNATNEILDFLFLKEDMPLNSFVVSAENATDILRCKMPGGEPVGYSIASILKEENENSSRIFSLYKAKEKLLPCFNNDNKTLIREERLWKIG